MVGTLNFTKNEDSKQPCFAKLEQKSKPIQTKKNQSLEQEQSRNEFIFQRLPGDVLDIPLLERRKLDLIAKNTKGVKPMSKRSLNISFNEELVERPVMATQGNTTTRSYRVWNFVTNQFFVVTETYDAFGQLIGQEKHGSFGPGMGQPC